MCARASFPTFPRRRRRRRRGRRRCGRRPRAGLGGSVPLETRGLLKYRSALQLHRYYSVPSPIYDDLVTAVVRL